MRLKNLRLLGLSLIGCSEGLLAHGAHITNSHQPNLFTHLFLDHPWVIALTIAAILVIRKSTNQIK